MRTKYNWICGTIFIWLLFVSAFEAGAVTSKVTRHSSGADMLKGEIENVVVSTKGTIQLGRSVEAVVEEFDDVWSVNSIVTAGGSIYAGTSPNGGIYRYSDGELTKIYPLETGEETAVDVNEPNDVNQPGDANAVQTQEYLTNEHIFAMSSDVAGRLLAGISGKECKLVRFGAEGIETLFEPNDANYIFAIAVGDAGEIYLGTGPEGKVYRLGPFGGNPEVIYDSVDKNILSLAIGVDGFVYAGSDSRGIVYRINPWEKTATVPYDSDADEITGLLFMAGELYAAGTSAKIVTAQTKFAESVPMAGRPESKGQGGNSTRPEGGVQLQIANTKKKAAAVQGPPAKRPGRKPSKSAKASFVFRVTKEGFVTEVFSEAAVFFALVEQDGKLLVGAGNNGQVFSIDPAAEEQQIIYEDEQASQVTTLLAVNGDLYAGTANPAKLVKLGGGLAAEGTYTSDLVDAGQPARWGKLQIEADIPPGCKVMVSSRSGNVKDMNDPSFSQWSDAVEIEKPVDLDCPVGRFCQYKLTLQTEDGKNSPVVREVAVAHMVPNLAPRVEGVGVARMEGAGKKGVFKVSYKAVDRNGDKLIYKIDFRKVGRVKWIELKEKNEVDVFEWDGKTVEDGRYEVRVTASDERSNTAATKLTGSRVSDVVVVDNTGPVVQDTVVKKQGSKVTLNLTASDKLSAIGRLDYTVDSNADWIGAVPDDMIYDTKAEAFTIVVEELKGGEHVIAVRVRDDAGNTSYKTFDVHVESD